MFLSFLHLVNSYSFQSGLIVDSTIFIKFSQTGIGARLASNKQMSRLVSSGSAVENQADEHAGVAQLTWRVSGR